MNQFENSLVIINVQKRQGDQFPQRLSNNIYLNSLYVMLINIVIIFFPWLYQGRLLSIDS